MNYDLMNECFNSMKEKAAYSFENSDLMAMYATLDLIEGPTLVTGVGGSSVVASFLAKVLRERNHLIATFAFPRDLLYMDTSSYRNVIAVSYSGNNIGVKVATQTDLKPYLFTGHAQDGFTNIVYEMLKEESYVSINATFVPLALILNYYLNDQELILKILDEDLDISSDNDRFEILYGYETSTAAVLLESSFIESSLASCVLHEKYNYCHGRINLSRNYGADLIFFRNKSELDDVLYETLKKHFRQIITIPKKYDDDLVNDFYSAVVAMKLIRKIAEKKDFDISAMKELPDNDVFYLFKGKMK